MKNNFFLLIISLIFTVSVHASEMTIQQIIKEKKVTINAKDKALSDILMQITKQTGIGCTYQSETVDKTKKFSLNVSNVSVEEALNTLFKNSEYTFRTVDSIIRIEKRAAATSQQSNKKIRISGGVIDEERNPVIGATIVVAGTNLGAISDSKGKFSIEVPQNTKLEVTFIGYTPFTKVINKAEDNLIVTLRTSIIDIDDVVVTGYQNIQQHENTGVTTRIKAADLDLSAPKSIEQMLEGKVAGMVISNPSGAIGQRQKVRVRGTSSILGNQEPVWVVDGMIQEDPLPFRTSDFNAISDGSGEGTDMIKDFVGNSISWLSPYDIEDITVLKDVSATVLYGVKAANGVIVIRTKRGQKGKATISYSGSLNVKSALTYDKLNMMNSKERVDVDREIIESGRRTGGVTTRFGFEYLYNLYLQKVITFEQFEKDVAKLETTNTDWLGILTRGTTSQKHAINVSGGSDFITYYASASYQKDNGNIPSNSSDKISVNTNTQTWIVKDKLNFSMAVRGNITTTNGLIGEDPFNFARKTTRSLPAYDENGDRYFFIDQNPELPKNAFGYNPEFEAENRKNMNESANVNGNMNLTWNVVKGLKSTTSFGFGYSSTTGDAYSTEQSNYITNIRKYEFGTEPYGTELYNKSELPHGGELRHSQTSNLNWTLRTQLDYNNIVGKSRFGATLGYEMRSTGYDGFDRITFGYMPDKGKIILPPPVNILNEKGESKENALYNKMRDQITDRLSNVMSIYANVSYSYDERYVFTGSIRSDATNRFGQNKKSAFLPIYSFGARWNISNEKFVKQIEHIINNASIKGSFGFQGNFADNYGPDLIVKYGRDVNQNFGTIPLIITRLPYNDLTWEKTKSYNLGVDLGVFLNRFQVSFNYYNKKTIDVIAQAEVAYEWGVASIPINDGELTNSGWDITVSTTPLRMRNFAWTLSMNTAKNYNKVNSNTEKKNDWKTAVTGNLVKDGYPISTVWGPIYNGINPVNGLPVMGFVDAGGDHDKEDVTTWLKQIGKLEPDFSGGISTSIRYKNLSVSASFTVNFGAKRWLANYMTYSLPRPMDNLSRELINRWRKPGDELLAGIMPGLPYVRSESCMDIELPTTVITGTTEAAVKANLYDLYNRSDDRFVSANFLKCNSISASYNLPTNLVASMKLSRINVGFSVSNPFKIASKDYKGIDPEVAVGGLPIASSYNISLTIGF